MVLLLALPTGLERGARRRVTGRPPRGDLLAGGVASDIGIDMAGGAVVVGGVVAVEVAANFSYFPNGIAHADFNRARAHFRVVAARFVILVHCPLIAGGEFALKK